MMSLMHSEIEGIDVYIVIKQFKYKIVFLDKPKLLYILTFCILGQNTLCTHLYPRKLSLSGYSYQSISRSISNV